MRGGNGSAASRFLEGFGEGARTGVILAAGLILFPALAPVAMAVGAIGLLVGAGQVAIEAYRGTLEAPSAETVGRLVGGAVGGMVVGGLLAGEAGVLGAEAGAETRAAAGALGVAEREAPGFLGSRGAPLANAPYQPLRNADGVIHGRTFAGHALDQMQNRGLMPSVVENAIRTGVRSPDPIVGRFRFFDAVNKVTVIAEGERVVTVVPGSLR